MDVLVDVVAVVGMTGVIATGVIAPLVPTLPIAVLLVAWARPQDWRRAAPADVPMARAA